MKEYAREFQKRFTEILKRVVSIANGNVSRKFLSSNEMVTKKTLDAEMKTSNLSGDHLILK